MLSKSSSPFHGSAVSLNKAPGPRHCHELGLLRPDGLGRPSTAVKDSPASQEGRAQGWAQTPAAPQEATAPEMAGPRRCEFTGRVC